MNLYIINEVLYDYTDGMAVIAADSIERCRELYELEFANSEYRKVQVMEEYDAAISYGHFKVLQVQGVNEGIVSYVYGGG